MGVVFYAMLVGQLPFNDCDVNTLLRQIHRGAELPRTLSKDCRDLALSLLSVKTPKRIQSDEMLSHPWFSVGITATRSVVAPKSTRGSRIKLKDVIAEAADEDGADTITEVTAVKNHRATRRHRHNAPSSTSAPRANRVKKAL
jgi:serine/threonine protein kinase